MNAPTAIPDLTDAWASTDPLGEALHFLRMSGTFYCRSEFTAPWGLDLPAMPQCLMFHVLTVGECWLEAEEMSHVVWRRATWCWCPTVRATGW